MHKNSTRCARAKDKSLSRYPEYAAYRARTYALIPFAW
jgi:hypothetical protein